MVTDVVNEARRKVMRGEPTESVRVFLKTSGLADVEADRLLESLVAERMARVRKTARLMLAVGAGLMAVPVIMGWVGWNYKIPQGYGYWSCWEIAATFGVVGLGQVGISIIYLLVPRLKKGDAEAVFGAVWMWLRGMFLG